jgi:hypothetical protein
VGRRPKAGDQCVGCEVPQLNRRRAGRVEVEIEAGDVVGGGREGLSVTKGIDLAVRDRLMLIGWAVRTRTIGAEKHIPTGRDYGDRSREGGGVIVIVRRARKPPEDTTCRVGIGRPVAEDVRPCGDDDKCVFGSGRDPRGRGELEVLLSRTVGRRPDAGDQIVCRVVPQLDRDVAGALELEVEPGHVVKARYERLAVAERVDLGAGAVLLLVRDSVGAGCRLWSRRGIEREARKSGGRLR